MKKEHKPRFPATSCVKTNGANAYIQFYHITRPLLKLNQSINQSITLLKCQSRLAGEKALTKMGTQINENLSKI